MSNNEEKGFTLLWGILFIYDFIYDQQLVSKEVQHRVMEHVAKVKDDMRRIYINDICRFDIVHTWGKLRSIDEESFEKEKEYFRQTFTNHTRIGQPKPTKQHKQLSMFDGDQKAK